MVKFIFTCVFIFSILSLQAQFKAKVVDVNTNKAVAFAYVFANDLNKSVITDEYGKFVFDDIMNKDSLVLTIQHLSYQIQTKKYKNNSHIFVKPKKLMVEDVLVTAQSKRNNASTSIIKKDAIAHIQATSFTDVLALLPGNRTQQKDFFSVNTISLRQVRADYNTSLGTLFSLDGAQISNEANFQNISDGSVSMYQSNSVTNKGVDMRMIGTDDIDQIEIIKGIASVEYGDLTSGVVNITRKKGYNPLEIRLKTDSDSKLVSVTKGFGDNNESVNISAGFLNNKQDPRSDLANFYRLNSSIRYNKNKKNSSKFLNYGFNFDFGKMFTESKKDYNASISRDDSYESTNNNYTLSTYFNWENLNRDFINKIDFNLVSSYTYNRIKQSKLTSAGSDVPIATVDEGRSEAKFFPIEYQAYYQKDNQPFSLSSKLKTVSDIDFQNIENKITIGGEYFYDKNLGDGDIYDKNLPPYPGAAYRPISIKDIPASQKISAFGQINTRIKFNRNMLKFNYGIRLNHRLGLSSKFDMHDKVFSDHRLSLNWKFPEFKLFGKDNILSIGAAMGQQSKLPGLSILYPPYRYFDYTEFNFYSQNEDLRTVHMYTIKKDITNYEIQTSKNKKVELNMSYVREDIRFSLTAFQEESKSGFSHVQSYGKNTYRNYNEDELDVAELTHKPLPSDVSYNLINHLVIYSRYGNGDYVKKRGIEYTLDLPKINAINTRIYLNGAYFKTDYDMSDIRYQGVDEIINNKSYPYVGAYTWNRGKSYENFGTNIFFNTAVNSLDLLFTTTLECTWFEKYHYIPNNGEPEYYLDQDLKRYEFTDEARNDEFINKLVILHTDTKFDRSKTPIDIGVNLKFTKMFGKNFQLSCFVNSIFNYLPEYNDRNGLNVIRKRYPYASMEIKVKI
ncbi:MAG: TonB-dependent receptor plug domain-containing protein [Marinifilaceae bacterium]|jgi:hypothetical protein|nr:TonB-dependent receptor plug domain-containing protein [Marinifilaceae bacterium]